MPYDSSPLAQEQDLSAIAKERGVRYFMISYTDLFGYQRAKLVPAVAIADMQKDGAGFAVSRPGSILRRRIPISSRFPIPHPSFSFRGIRKLGGWRPIS